MIESTRLLLLVLLLVSFAVILPVPVRSAHEALGIPVLVGAIVLLVASWTVGYWRRSAPFAADLLDAVAVGVVAVSSAVPPSVYTFVFPLVWFRSQYGSARQAALRCLLLMAAMLTAQELWPHLSARGAAPALPPLIGAFPGLLLTAVASRKLVAILAAREQAARRDAVVATLGTRLLGVTDRAEIHRLAWQAVAGICAATAGLRVLKVTGTGARLHVEADAGPFRAVPASFPRTDLPTAGEAETAPHAALDVAAGTACRWRTLTSAEFDVPALVLGRPGGLTDEVVASVTSIRVLLALALRNSTVHSALSSQARLDGLTGLANRASFREALAQALTLCAEQSVTVLFVDLDDFKDVNDRLGHGAGDEVLRLVAGILRGVTRGEDLCARLGGDEFAVLLRGTDVDEAGQVAARVVAAVAAPVAVGDGTASIGASVGIAVATADSGLEELIRQADVAMYAAKAAGKGRVQVFEDGLLTVEPVVLPAY